jgi:hypothetical protein
MKSKIAIFILIFSLLAKFSFAGEHANYNVKMDSLSKAYPKTRAVSDSTKVVPKNKNYEPLAIYGAVASVVTLLTIIVFATLSITFFIPLLLIISSLVLNILALKSIRKNKKKGKGLAIFGIVFSTLPYILIIGLAVWALNVFNNQ